jgi:hypothetical protein
MRLTDHHLRTSLSPLPTVESPFTWSAVTARRGLGLAAMRLLVSGDVRTPTDGVRAAMAQALRVHRGQRPTSSMDGWLAGLGPPARAAVAAEAVTWATRLWTALDWGALQAPIIGQDRWWDSPHSSMLALRSRAEVRVSLPDEEGAPLGVHLVLLGGPRRASVRDELSVVALVEALRAPQAPPPGRVVGWWADSGRLVRVDVDGAVLQRGADVVAHVLGGGLEQAAA